MTGHREPVSERTGPLQRLWGVASEAALGTMIAALCALIALAAYQGSAAAAPRDRADATARQLLDEAHTAYLAANQEIIRDYARFDSWRLARDDPGSVEGHAAAFSPALRAAIDRSADDPFDDAYYQEMYAAPNARFAQADAAFEAARAHDRRGDRLQLVVVAAAVGLACAAWASLLGAWSRWRPVLAALTFIALALGAGAFITAPALPG